jgi:hypothetical protein
MEIAFLWFVFAIIVGVAANARGHNGLGWFVLSLIISPLIAGLLVLAMKRRDTAQQAFEPDTLHAGIPYRMGTDGAVEAIIQGARVRFSDYGKFSAATGAPPISLPTPLNPNRAPNWDRSGWAWFVFLMSIGLILLLTVNH